MGIKEALSKYPAQFESVQGTHVGRVVVSANGNGVDFDVHESLIARELKSSESTRRIISSYMNNNSRNLCRERFQIERGASAYFTWDPAAREVAIEWGEIVGKKAKLHTYLNQVLDPSARHAKGMTVRSGHITEINPGGIVVCMLDSVWRAEPIVDTLSRNGFLVIDGLGDIQGGDSV